MSVDAKWNYRFVYLKSEHWKNLRIEKLAQCDAVCQVCKYRGLENDVHHVYYRNLYDVKLSDLRVLCRNCHKAIHKLLDSGIGKSQEDQQKRWRACVSKLRTIRRKVWQACVHTMGAARNQREARVYRERFKKSRRWLIRNGYITIPEEMQWSRKLYRWYVDFPRKVTQMDWLNATRELRLGINYPCGDH